MIATESDNRMNRNKHFKFEVEIGLSKTNKASSELYNSKTIGDKYNLKPFRSKTRELSVRYLVDGNVMKIQLNRGYIFVRVEHISSWVFTSLLSYKLYLGPLGKIGIEKTFNPLEERPVYIKDIDMLIDDVNNGKRKAKAWLFSHAFSGRIKGSSSKESKTSWIPKKTIDGQEATVSLKLKALTDYFGNLAKNENGDVFLPIDFHGEVALIEDIDEVTVKILWVSKSKVDLNDLTYIEKPVNVYVQ